MLQLKISIITSVIKILVGQGDGMNTSPGIRIFSSQLSYSFKKNEVTEQMQPLFLYLHDEGHNKLLSFKVHEICKKIDNAKKKNPKHNLQLMKGILYCTYVPLTFPGLWFSQMCWRCLAVSHMQWSKDPCYRKENSHNHLKIHLCAPKCPKAPTYKHALREVVSHIQCFSVVNQ